MTYSAANRILLTGFDPFAGFTTNPSATVARKLDGASIGGCHVVSRILPVVFGQAGDDLVAAIRETRPAAVICLGLAARRTDIGIERLAVNLDDADIPDNAGNQPVEREVVPGAPLAYRATLPVKVIVTELQVAGLAASLSMSAGTFVCNHVFYRLMHYLQDHPGIPGGFVHLPPVADNDASSHINLESAVAKIIEVTLSRTPNRATA